MDNGTLPQGGIVRGDLTEQPPDSREHGTTLTGEPWGGERDRGPPNCSSVIAPREGLHSKETREEDGGRMFSFLLLEFEKSYYNVTFII